MDVADELGLPVRYSHILESLNGQRGLTLVLSENPALHIIHAILGQPAVMSIVVPIAQPSHAHDSRMGIYSIESGVWKLPRRCARRIVLADANIPLGIRFSLCALFRGYSHVMLRKGDEWHSEAITRLLLRQLQARIMGTIRWAGSRLLARLRTWPTLYRALVKLAHYCPHLLRIAYRLKRGPEVDEASFSRLVSLNPCGYEPVVGRILHVAPSLQPGGAERQVVNSLKATIRAGFTDVQLICDYLDAGFHNHNFYLDAARHTGAAVSQLSLKAWTSDSLTSALYDQFLQFVPATLLKDILNTAAEIRIRRPEVVHAWLDWSCVRAGLAAALAGTPRIILSGRNLNPSHFALYEPYMRPAYSVLSRLPSVLMINNSRVGAADYAAWLGLSAERIKVVRNALDFAATRASDHAVETFRRSLNIPPGSRVVGSMFRFNEEKRPLLWIGTAALIAASAPDVHFVIFGDGKMRSEMEALRAESGLEHKLHLPGLVNDTLTALSGLDLFLLTSFGEGTPNVALEAQYVGTPVLLTDAGGARECVHEGVTGRVFYASDPDPAALAEAAMDMLNDTSLRASALRSGPAFIGKGFSMKRLEADLANLYTTTDKPMTAGSL
jgi:glycosyltransferase involved in cell wall biosynthesis